MRLKSGLNLALIFTAALALTAPPVRAQYGPPGPPPPPPGQPYQYGPWANPNQVYRQQLQRDAFRAGIEGARRDLENNRRPNVLNRDEYRNYRGPAPRLYRQAFQNGYNTFWAHRQEYRR